KPIDTTNDETTADEWWTTPRGWTGGPIDENTTWYWNETWNETDPDWNSTNGSTTKKPGRDNFGHQYSLTFSFLLLIISTLIIA
ncbi:hypothetical protein PFISCL1PPCAC_6498, partial [Pristionchus fissidentatus]